jgi:hypothetical protein
MSGLRDFLYLDVAKLHSFVSQIQGGLISEVSEKLKQLGGLSAGLNVGVAPFSGKVDTSKGKETERQYTIQLTDPVYFDVVYRHLTNEQQLSDITAASLQTRENLYVGQFVELRGFAEPPVVESWLEQLRSMFTFFEKHAKSIPMMQPQGKGRAVPTISSQQTKQFKTIVDLLVDYISIARKDPGKQYIRITADKQAFNVWSGLIPDYIFASLQANLPADVRIFGRVERLLKVDETWKIVDLALFNQTAQANQLLTALNGLSTIMRQDPLSENDFQVQHPDIIISPIAIYR